MHFPRQAGKEQQTQVTEVLKRTMSFCEVSLNACSGIFRLFRVSGAKKPSGSACRLPVIPEEGRESAQCSREDARGEIGRLLPGQIAQISRWLTLRFPPAAVLCSLPRRPPGSGSRNRGAALIRKGRGENRTAFCERAPKNRNIGKGNYGFIRET